MHVHQQVLGAEVHRRRLLAGTATLAGAALAASLTRPDTAEAARGEGDPLPAPRPIPGGTQVPNGPLVHIFLPGPTNVTLPFTGLPLEGLDVEPSTITDFRGFTALAYTVGSARGNDGRRFNLECDMRMFDGTYVAETGARREGTFAMI
jgi:hypothetical protein